MIIGIWALIVTCIVMIMGEIKYRCLDKKEVIRENQVVSEDWKDNVDVDMDKLSVERINGEFVPSQVLSRRGSWRLAQNQVMGAQTFSVLRSEEYVRML